MQYRIFTCSVFADGDMMEEMNRFLRSNKVVNTEKQLITTDSGSFWTFCVHYIGMAQKGEGGFPAQSSAPKIDYKTVLDEKTFEVFSVLRSYRKQLADADSVPAYAVFTDAELAEISKLEAITPENIGKNKSIAAKKTEKYAGKLCELYGKNPEEENPASPPPF